MEGEQASLICFLALLNYTDVLGQDKSLKTQTYQEVGTSQAWQLFRAASHPRRSQSTRLLCAPHARHVPWSSLFRR